MRELLLRISSECFDEGHRLSLLRRLRDYAPAPIQAADAQHEPAPNPQREVQTYRDLANSLDRRIQKRFSHWRSAPLPKAVRERGPSSLLELDVDIWKSRDWEDNRNFVRDFYSLVVGAYLGCVLEANLGGDWEPSEHFVGSRLRIGGRAYYPFLRAQQCQHGVRYRVLRYSLYHYYREIELALSVP